MSQNSEAKVSDAVLAGMIRQYQIHRDELLAKWAAAQKEIDEAFEVFRVAHGDEAASTLGDLALVFRPQEQCVPPTEEAKVPLANPENGVVERVSRKGKRRGKIRTRWAGHVERALKDEPEGLNYVNLKAKLVKNGVQLARFTSGFRKSLRRLAELESIVFKGGIYYLGR